MDMPLLRSRMARIAAVPGLLLALAACAAGESSSPATSSPTIATAPATASTAAPVSASASADSGLAALIQASGVKCSDASKGAGCTAGDVDSGDFYDVELSPACGEQGFFAGVAEDKGVDTLDAVPSTGSRVSTTARLSKGQLVCVQAIGRAGQNPLFYYLVAIPAATVGKCKGSALCETYGDRPISGMKEMGSEACHVAGPGHYAGNCAQGWVSADVLDLFSDGM